MKTSEADSICSEMEVMKEESQNHDHSDELSGYKPRRKIATVCLVGDFVNIELLLDALKKLEIEVYQSETGLEYKEREDVGFVFQEFRSSTCSYLRGANSKLIILGPTVVLECAQANTELTAPRKNRPLYCSSMKDVILCISGLRKKKVITGFVDKVHYMGGSVRGEFTQHITHLVSTGTQSEKYRLAIGLGRPAVSLEWINYCWENRDTPNQSAVKEDLIARFKLQPFEGLKIAFEGFIQEELDEFSKLTNDHGGTVVEKGPDCSVLVIDNNGMTKLQISEIILPNGNCEIVTAEWFWVSIQLDLCANCELYPVEGVKASTRSSKRALTPANFEYEPMRPPRRSKRFASADRLSNDSVFEGSSNVSDVLPEHIFSTEDIEAIVSSPNKAVSKRQQTCMELLQTENNYVDVLRTINMQFRVPLESMEQNGSEPLLTKGEMALIFSKVKPIYEIHQQIAHKLMTLVSHWNEHRTIGQVWIDAADRLRECYPPFVNNFDKAKETLVECDETRPKFHAFIKACQSRPECHRQSLQDLLMRPVQRLPSVILLLSDILKRTDKSNTDHSLLIIALEKIKEVTTHINENKRKTEDRIKIFEIFNSIKNCPTELVSGQRQFVAKLEVIDTDGTVADKGRQLTLYLFNDSLEVTRSRNNGPLKLEGPADSSGFRRPATTQSKSRKHVDLFLLSVIRKVTNVKTDYGDLNGLFCLTTRDIYGDTECPFYTDAPIEEKLTFLRTLCAQIINTAGRTEVGLHDYDLGSDKESPFDKTLCKALSHVHHQGRRLTRNLSFSKSRNTLRRAVSQMAVGFGGTLRRMSRSNLHLHMAQSITEENSSPMSSPSTSSLKRMNILGSKRTLPSSGSFAESPHPVSSRRRPVLGSEADVFHSQV